MKVVRFMKSDKILKYLTAFIYIVMGIVLLFYLYNTVSFITISFFNTLILLIAIVVVITLLYLAFSMIYQKHQTLFLLALFAFSLLLYGLWGLFAPLRLISDYEVLYQGAQAILAGTFGNLSFSPDNYFYFYNFQIGYTTFLSLVMRLFGDGHIGLHLFEVLIQATTNILLFLSIKKMFNPQVAIAASLIYLTFMFNILGSNILNNQHLSVFFVALSLFISTHIKLGEKKTYLFMLLSGSLLALAYITRQTTIIFILAFIVIIFLGLFTTEDFSQKGVKLLLAGLFFLSYFGMTRIVDTTIVHNHLAPSSILSGNAKYFKFWLGISGGEGVFGTKTTDARQTQVYYDLKSLDFDYDAYNEQTMDKVKHAYLNDFPNTFMKVERKMRFFTGALDHQYVFGAPSDKMSVIEKYPARIGHLQYFLTIISVFALILVVLFTKNSRQNNYRLFFVLVFLALFCAHIFMEVQTRYRYEQYFVLAILAAEMFVLTFDKIRSALKEK